MPSQGQLHSLGISESAAAHKAFVGSGFDEIGLLCCRADNSRHIIVHGQQPDAQPFENLRLVIKLNLDLRLAIEDDVIVGIWICGNVPFHALELLLRSRDQSRIGCHTEAGNQTRVRISIKDRGEGFVGPCSLSVLRLP